MRFRKLAKKNSRKRQLKLEALGDRLLLSVNQVGSQLIIEGDANVDDDILLTLSDNTSQYEVLFNGETTIYDPTTIDEIFIDGAGGDDTLLIDGSPLTETFEFDDGILTISSGNNYTVNVSNTEGIFASTSFGNDRVIVRDTVNDDLVQIFSDRVFITNDQGTTVIIEGANRIQAYAENGGNDRIEYLGSDADELFVSHPEFSFMFQPDALYYSEGFESVEAISGEENGGSDRAWIFGTAGDDTVANSVTTRSFDSSPFGTTLQDTQKDQVLLTRDGGTEVAILDFGEVHVFAGNGRDSGTLQGHDGVSDRFEWSDTEASLVTAGSSTTSSREYVLHDFEQMVATGGENIDRADLTGSVGDDSIIAIPEAVQITTPDAEVLALDFQLVVARGGGGTDFAHLEDSEFNDDFTGKQHFAYMQGHDYLNLLIDVDVIDVASFNGGFDEATSSQYAGTTDFVVWDGPQYWIFGQNRNERIFGMDDARGIGEDEDGDSLNGAGWETLRALEHPWTFAGAHDQNFSLSASQSDALAARNETPVGNYDLVDGRLQRVGDAPVETDSDQS